ncbi:ArsR family transcriptional regulator [Pseudooceanicola sp. CBS1P-1]|uniref:Metalloregulator ArsR/SmtB family transcription factor n=1 Tax=Pseudooceanicola albus TaxID=2692189 RepID=A0A6L7G2M6_9RHOB|nr:MULTISPECIES: helix-turn-helix transcriptional regulator [Pseudooceanicola]MBT9382290.1 ArsR family transcriptional regulator [Pseudooceanicola endophyticus]MXN16833.1 metalloregulator ArsR/SmtB family transcription factor [Pseudooceanicola albus]
MDKTAALTCLSALAHETRLDILRLLIAEGPEGLPARAIGDQVAAPASRLSFHLSALETAGLVRAMRRGRQIFYAADRATMGGMIGYLMDDCCARDETVRACCQHPAALPGDQG